MKKINITREEFLDTLCEIIKDEFITNLSDVIKLSQFTAKAEIEFFGDDDEEDEPEQIEARFKVGDKVRVRDDLEVDEIYGDDCFVKEMTAFAGEVVTISSVCDKCYKIREDPYDYNWTDEMFDNTEAPFKVGDKVFVIDNKNDGNRFVNQVVTVIEVFSDGSCEVTDDTITQSIYFINLRKVETP